MDQKRSTLMLLASIIVLHWMTVFAKSDSSNSTLNIIKRQLPPETREKTQKTLNVAKDSLSLFKDVVNMMNSEKLTTVMKGISRFASLAPGVAATAFSVVNMVLAFIPQDDPVLNEVKKGFNEVNRKLDSLSVKISNLATDVEWFNYVSVYSRDEATILNAWKRFNDLHLHSNLVKRAKDGLTLSEKFIRYYENSGVESSVSNFYRYLTGTSISLHGNLINLLKKKLKCDINKMGRYNSYLSSLLWKGMVLNQFYWKMAGVNMKGKEDQPAQLLKKVSEAQLAEVEFCLQNYEDYLKKDVVEIVKDLSPDNKKAIADQVKEALDNKYSWYCWVVLVIGKEKNHLLHTEFTFNINGLLVGVDYTVKANMINVKQVKDTAKECFEYQDCNTVKEPQSCSRRWYPRDHSDEIFIPFEHYAKVTQVTYGDQYVEVPTPFQRLKCKWWWWNGLGWSKYDSWISVHYSRNESVCKSHQCKNNGTCRRLLRSNEWLCDCLDGYYGDTCEKKLDMTVTKEIGTFTIPTLVGIVAEEQTTTKLYILIICVVICLVALVLIMFRKHFPLCCRQNSCLELKQLVDMFHMGGLCTLQR
ncbi:PREDICTED: uncharacterized protein LOC107101141 [Cyprinodon variegatus]|uniref:uncharacterized protein LOC107101141 n=1 Tax=Cyprinodon variegatus TaxID=28743 RepID=UPI0007428FB8|nr:PREDICTED: uncharacterized protein LOC107101141 [Cyprinodon variegatus]